MPTVNHQFFAILTGTNTKTMALRSEKRGTTSALGALLGPSLLLPISIFRSGKISITDLLTHLLATFVKPASWYSICSNVANLMKGKVIFLTLT